MKAIIYCRVSSQRQVSEGDGLGSQEQRCRKYAVNAGYKVIGVFREEGESGGLFDRTAMRQVLMCLEANDTKDPDDKIVVIFDDLKRFARDTEVHFRLKREIYGRNGRVESPNFRFEDTPDGKFVETVMAAAAGLERDQNTRQVIQKQQARLERGYWPFMLPLGLINKKDPIHGKIPIPREPHASIYKTAIEKYRDRLLFTQEDVMHFLHEEYKTRGLSNRPSLSTTARILSEPLYAGYMKHDKRKIPFKKAQHEGFISLETYNLVQKRVQERTKPWKRRDYADTFPLRPHVLCDACNKPMTASWCTGRKGTRYPHYFCRVKDCIYKWKTTGKEKFETKFEELLKKVQPKDYMVDLTKDVLQEQWGMKLDNYTALRNRIAADVEETDAAIQSYLVRIRKTKDEDLIFTYEEEIKKLKVKKKQGEQDLSKRKYTNEEFGTASDKVFNTLKDPMSMWKSDEYNDKRTILFMYFEEELRYDYKLGFGTAGLAYPINLINELGQAKTSSVEMSSIESRVQEIF